MSKNYTLITGATSGIGYEFARQFALAGHNLILASRNSAKMQEIKNKFIAQYKIDIECIEIDLSIIDSAKKLFELCQNFTVDILINNSGIGLDARLHIDRTQEDIQYLINLNIIALTELARLFGKKMQERRSGYIVNIASTAAFQPMPYSAIYGASKSYVLMLSESMAIELKPYNVGVTAVCPGLTDTNFFKYGKPTVPAWIYNTISPEIVVRNSIKAMYQKKIYIIPYFQHWLFAQLSRFVPRKAIANLMSFIEKKRKRADIAQAKTKVESNL